ncbi:MAG: transcriptional repressor NrdR [Planctomycetota bacterium]|nr:MAG: transcriptional repressor NrdR [Planctomycetota bacterium]
MRCPFCNENDDKVIDSRSTDGGRCVRRRRMCLRCKRRYTTYEHIEDRVKLSVIKRDGTRSPYDRNKIREAIRQAAYKRPITAERLDQIVEEVEEQIIGQFEKEVSSQTIGEYVAEALRRVDQVAYVRFASVYRQFQDVGDFIEEAQQVIEKSAADIPGQQDLFAGDTERE